MQLQNSRSPCAEHIDVQAVTDIIQNMDNLFNEGSSANLLLDILEIMQERQLSTPLTTLRDLGITSNNYVKERTISQTKPIAQPIKKNNLSLSSTPPVSITEKFRDQQQLSSLERDCSLFSRPCTASQIRDDALQNPLSMKIRYERQDYHKCVK